MSLLIIFLLLVITACKHVEISEVIELQDRHKFCFIGDLGKVTRGQKQVAEALSKEACDTVFALGDLVYENGIKDINDILLRDHLLDPFQKTIEKSDFFLLLGNHDYRSNTHAWTNINKLHQNLKFPNYYYRVNAGDICFVALDTNNYFLEQYFWLKGMSLQKKCSKLIFMGHHPLKSSGKHGSANLVNSIFLKGVLVNADLYIAGHEHQLSNEGVVFGKTIQFISGAGSKLRELKTGPGVWGKSTYGYLIITLESNNELKYAFKGLKDDEFQVLHSGIL